MANGDVLQLDSAQPGGSGTIEGETKFVWGPSPGPAVLASLSIHVPGTLTVDTPIGALVPVGKSVALYAAFAGGELDGDEIIWGTNFSADQMQIFLRKDGATVGQYFVRCLNSIAHDLDVLVKVVII